MSSKLLWEKLCKRLRKRVNQFPGVMGLSVKDLQGGLNLSVNGCEVFPAASTIKIHVLTELLTKAERGELDLTETIRVTSDLRVPGSGVLASMENEVTISVLDIAILMITVSDNTATNMCIDMAGINDTNALLDDLGLKATRLRRKMQDKAAVVRNDENVSTPDECVAMLEHLEAGRPSPWVASQCLSILKKNKLSPLTNSIPPGITIANKPGAMDRVRCDAGIVYLPNRPYAVAVMTKFNLDNPHTVDHSLADVIETIHETMMSLDKTNNFGLGVPQTRA
jgi:beta-lactamase class A